MDCDMNKFKLVVYEKNNISNRKELKIEGKEKTCLSTIDMWTSTFLYSDLRDLLLKNGLITKEQTEFVIWYKEKNSIKQIPVIFKDDNIKIYSSYLYLTENEDKNEFYSKLKKQKGDIAYEQAKEKTKEFYEKLKEITFWNFINKVNNDSEEYNQLSSEYKEKYMNGDNFSARFVRMPFIKSDIKTSVTDRIIGICRDSSNIRVKGGKLFTNNFGNIKKEIETSYRNFRDAYLFLKTNNNFENTHQDLDYKTIYEKQIDESKSKEELKSIKKQILETKSEVETIYNFNDLDRILTTGYYRLKNSFSNFADTQDYLTKKIKTYIYRAAQSDAYQNDEVNDYLSKIGDYDAKHPGCINKLITGYHQYMNNNKHSIELMDEYNQFTNSIQKVIKK